MLKTMTRRATAIARPLRVGEIVEIRPLAEIVATLDESGRLDGMPFMPEMAAYCGQRATVVKRAHKTCDGHANLRWLDDTVHLDGLRCDGSAHGGCQAKCLTFWKTAWLKRADEDASATRVVPDDSDNLLTQVCTPARVTSDGTLRYTCQATEVNAASRPLPASELKQYVWDLSSGNVSVWTMIRFFLRTAFNRYQRWSAEHLPAGLLIREGHPLGRVQGQETKTPKETLDLEVGERVRVRPLSQIEPTLNRGNSNRGLLFDSEMASRCGSTSTVAERVERLVNDETGEMIEIKSDCLILDGITCGGENRRLCSRSAIDYWREIWLERETD